MDYDGCSELEEPSHISNKDWLKASSASLAKLQEVGTKIYNLGFTDKRQLKVNKHTILVAGNTQAAINSEIGLTKTAWGSNSSVPDLLRRQNERQRTAKVVRPVSAKNAVQRAPPRTRERPHSAKELGAGDTAHRKPPSWLGVKGIHHDLESRPPGGIGTGTGVGWTSATHGSLFGMNNKEINDVLDQISISQQPLGSKKVWLHDTTPVAPPPPRGSPDFSEMLNRCTDKGSEFSSLIDNLLFDPELEPSDIITHPPPVSIHVTMPSVADQDGSDSSDLDDSPTNDTYRSSNTSRPTLKKIGVTMNSHFDDYHPSQSEDEAGKAGSGARGRPHMRTVTFNENRNETTIITPRGARSKMPIEDDTEYAQDKDASSINTKVAPAISEQDYLLKPQLYTGPTDLKWVKSRTDSGIPLSSQDECQLSALRKGSAKGRGSTAVAENTTTAASMGEKTQSSPAIVSVAYLDDLMPEQEIQKPPHKEKRSKKVTSSHLRDDVETMVSRVTLNEENDRSDKEDKQWATVGSLTTKVVSGQQKNYYEAALQTRLANHRIQQQQQMKENESKKTKTIKTFELGDGEMIEYKTVSTVDIFHHPKKDYVIPKEALPPSPLKSKVVEGRGEHKVQSKSQPFKDIESHRQCLAAGDSQLLTPSPSANTQHGLSPRSGTQHGLSPRSGTQHGSSPRLNTQQGTGSISERPGSSRRPRSPMLDIQHGTGSNSERPGSSIRPRSPRLNMHHGTSSNTKKLASSIGSRTMTPGSADRPPSRPPSRQAVINQVRNSSLKEKKMEPGTTLQQPAKTTCSESQLMKLKKQRAVSAPVRWGRTSEQARLLVGGAGGGALSKSPYAATFQRQRPYSASILTDMKKRPISAQHPKASSKLSYKEIQRVKTAAKLVKKGTLGHPKNFNTERYYSNYTQPPPPKSIVPVLRKKKAVAAAMMSEAAVGEKEAKEPSVVQMWTRQQDFHVETEGISDCKKIQDRLLDQGVPVTLDTLTRALLPPGECALLGATYVTNTNPTLPEYTSRLLSKPAVWFPEEFNRLQRARKLAQRAEQSLKDQDWEERNRVYMTSGMSVNSTDKKKTKKKKKKKKKEIDSRSSSGI